MWNLQMTSLCPQHWAQKDAMSSPGLADGMVCYTMAEVMVLEWDQQKFRKTVNHSQTTHTPAFYTSPSIKLYKSFCLQFNAFHAKVAPQEVILKTTGATHGQH